MTNKNNNRWRCLYVFVIFRGSTPLYKDNANQRCGSGLEKSDTNPILILTKQNGYAISFPDLYI